jgi:hypothetical protein
MVAFFLARIFPVLNEDRARFVVAGFGSIRQISSSRMAVAIANLMMRDIGMI